MSLTKSITPLSNAWYNQDLHDGGEVYRSRLHAAACYLAYVKGIGEETLIQTLRGHDISDFLEKTRPNRQLR